MIRYWCMLKKGASGSFFSLVPNKEHTYTAKKNIGIVLEKSSIPRLNSAIAMRMILLENGIIVKLLKKKS